MILTNVMDEVAEVAAYVDIPRHRSTHVADDGPFDPLTIG